MKVVLVHDYIKEYGGAERVLEALHEVFPDAPIYTTVYLPKFLGPHRERFRDWKIKTSFLQYFPFKAKLISPFRLLSGMAFKSFDFSGYDVVIVSATGAYFPNTIKLKANSEKLKAKLVCYCHTPPRYLYGYATARNWKKNLILRVLGETANYFLRKTDKKASKNVDYYIANSEEVASRIKKFYNRDSVIIYPPVDIQKIHTDFKLINTNKDQRKSGLNPRKYYYLAGGRLARAKGMDVIIEAFSELGLPLKVFGKGFAGYEKELKANSEKRKTKIEFLGEVTDGEKAELMRNAKAFVFASYDEDFGITPVEAMSVGTPVIAFKSGGVQETVIDGKIHSAGSGSPTGLFYEVNDSEHLVKAIEEFEHMKIDPKDCINQAKKFSKERFEKEIREAVSDLTKNKVSEDHKAEQQ